MASSGEIFEDASPNPRARLEWRAGVLQLATLLMLSSDSDIKRRMTDLFLTRRDTHGSALIAELQTAANKIVEQCAQAIAFTLGTSSDAAIQFHAPNAGGSELKGDFAVQRRLDRVWGGVHLISLETLQPTMLNWPGPRPGHAIVLRGAASWNRHAASLHTLIDLKQDDELSLDRGTLALLNREPLATVLEAAAAAGLNFEAFTQAPPAARPVVVNTTAGALSLNGTLVRLNRRRMRVSANEAATLRCLAESPGQLVTRKALADLLDVQPSTLDHIVVALRDKLGDGLIVTIYGSGYLLEAEAERSAAQSPS